MQVKRYTIDKSKTRETDINPDTLIDLPLGKAFTSHIFICNYFDKEWQKPRIIPFQDLKIHPAAMALHYGQAVFEGLKATIGENGPALFRVHDNALRLNESCRRMGMPELPTELFEEAVKALVETEKNWIPQQDGSTLYVRPFIFADEGFIGMRAATSYQFIVMCSPANPFFSKRIKLKAEEKFIRAAKGGTGEAKAAGNYAAAILPTQLAWKENFDQVLWLDAQEHQYIQEVGTMNIFFVIDCTIVTPPLNGVILDGITRKSTIKLLKYHGYEVVEREVRMDELHELHESGRLKEAFGTGTAVNIAFIEEITHSDKTIVFPDDSPISRFVKTQLDGIKNQKIDDPFNWITTL